MRFINFFDFDVLGHRDFVYYRVRIVESKTHPELVGRDSLILASYARLEFETTG
jgi:hypothetical protein